MPSFSVALNVDVTVIRKRKISNQLVQQNDDYHGPVIVKTDLNSAGIPESILYDGRLQIFLLFNNTGESLFDESEI